MLKCRFCEAQHPTRDSVIKHEINFHQFNPNFSIQCDYPGCLAIFSKAKSYQSHKSRHKNCLHIDPALNLVSENTNCRNDEIGSDHESHENMEVDENQENIFQALDTEEAVCDVDLGASVKQVSAKLLLHLRANSSITLTTLGTVISHVEAIVKQSLAQEIKDFLLEHCVISDIFELPKPSLEKVFEGLENTYKQDKYFAETFNVLQPQRVDMTLPRPEISGSSMDSINRPVKLKPVSMMYVSIIDTIKSLMKNKNYSDLMKRSNPSESDVLGSYKDGENFKTSQFFRNHSDGLRIILYFDGLDPCNGLGSKAGRHSIGVVYMSLENIPARYRSGLRFVHLIAIAYMKNINEAGIDECLAPVVADLKKIEGGLRINDEMIYGCLVAFSGDNAAVHAVGGFKEGFTANHPCRTCLADLVQVRKSTEPVCDLLRTEESYQSHIKLLNEASLQKQRLSVSQIFGINRESILNELPYISVVKNLPPDAMHDLFEGALPFTVKRLLKKVTDAKILSLSEINQHINGFDYGYSEIKSKPSEIKIQLLDESGTLRQSSSQMWLLSYILPIILGPLIPVDCDFYEVFLQLLQASSIIMAHKVSPDMLELLRIKTNLYAEGFLMHYRQTLIPKQHYILHYVQYMIDNGPISQFWSMRMKARHQFFKSKAYKAKNYKNVPLTLVKRNQLWEASQRLGSFEKASVSQCSESTEKPRATAPYRNVLPDNWPSVLEVPYVQINNLFLQVKQCCLAVNFNQSESLPVFAYLQLS